jgi:hypothetical protein
MTLHRLIEAGKLRHDGDERLRTRVLAAATKGTERGWRLIKTFRTRADSDGVCRAAGDGDRSRPTKTIGHVAVKIGNFATGMTRADKGEERQGHPLPFEEFFNYFTFSGQPLPAWHVSELVE